jgi:hypothetical protein
MEEALLLECSGMAPFQVGKQTRQGQAQDEIHHGHKNKNFKYPLGGDLNILR